MSLAHGWRSALRLQHSLTLRTISTGAVTLQDGKPKVDEVVDMVTKRSKESHEDDGKGFLESETAEPAEEGQGTVFPEVRDKKGAFPRQSKQERGKQDQEAQEGEAPSKTQSYVEKKN